MDQVYSLELLQQIGLVNSQADDIFHWLMVFPCSQNGGVVDLNGRSLGDLFAHRFLPGSLTSAK